MTFVHWSSSTFRMDILSERSRRKHYFHEKRCGISLASTKEPNALETCLVEAETGRLQPTDRTIQRILKKDRRTSAEKVAAEIKKQLNLSLSTQSVQNRAHEIGTFDRIAKKMYVNKVNRS